MQRRRLLGKPGMSGTRPEGWKQEGSGRAGCRQRRCTVRRGVGGGGGGGGGGGVAGEKAGCVQ